MSDTQTIHTLMRVPMEQQDVTWLKQALQFAVRLELATIPPYLCALWSVKNTQDPVYGLIRSVVLEEMLHMAQACNLLTTIGGVPGFATPDTVPTYPGPLPGGVHPGLIVPLQELSLEALRDVFLQIELPENGPIQPLLVTDTYATIGQFYDAIAAAFACLPAEAITGKNQIAITFNATGEEASAIHTSADAAAAITMIKHQGEGTPLSPDAPIPGGQVELAHYYKFAEILHGRTFVPGPDGSWSYTGDLIPFPDTYPVGVVPKEGYGAVTNRFNVAFTTLLVGLQNAWATGASDINSEINAMFDLTKEAVALMQTPVPGGTGNYAPDFRLMPVIVPPTVSLPVNVR